MTVRDLFRKNIFRPINGVVKADQTDESTVWQELDEFVVTRELTGHIQRFFGGYAAGLDNPATSTSPAGSASGWPASSAPASPT